MDRFGSDSGGLASTRKRTVAQTPVLTNRHDERDVVLSWGRPPASDDACVSRNIGDARGASVRSTQDRARERGELQVALNNHQLQVEACTMFAGRRTISAVMSWRLPPVASGIWICGLASATSRAGRLPVSPSGQGLSQAPDALDIQNRERHHPVRTTGRAEGSVPAGNRTDKQAEEKIS